jgi:deoxycytidylate deaminase
MIDYPPPLLAAIKLAENSTYKHRHGAVIVKHGKIISRGTNQLRYHKLSKYYEYRNSLHAESCAILRTRCDVRKTVLYVARINNAGNPRLSAPCKECTTLLHQMGIKSVIYTTNDGWEKIKL